MKQGWEIKKLGEVCEIINGFAFKSQLFKDCGDDILRISNIQNGVIDDSEIAHFSKEDYPKINFEKYAVLPDDIVVALSGATTGKFGVNNTGRKLYLNQRVAICREKTSKLHHLFLLYFLQTQSKSFLESAAGVAQPNLSTEQMKQYAIPVPPLPEQEKIVSELDCLSGIIEKKRQQLKELDALAQSIFYEMFGNPVDNERGWDTYVLKDVSTLLNGRAYKQNELLSEGKYKVLRVGNFFTNGNYYYSDLELDEDKYCDNGDLLFAWSASFGAFIWDGEKVIYHYHIWKVLYDKQLLDIQYYRFLLNTMTNYFMKDVHGIGMVHLTKAGMEEYVLPIPPLPLQQSFAQKIEAIEQQKALIKQSIAEVETLFNARMQEYFE
jgi:type I restriction enzyme S subunit